MHLGEPTTSSPDTGDKPDLSEFDPEMVQAALAYQSTLENIQNTHETDSSIYKKLQKLYETGDKETLATMIDDIADEAMEHHPSYAELIDKIKAARAKNQDVSGYATEIDRLKEHFKKMVVSMAELPDEERFTEIEKARGVIRRRITEQLGEREQYNLDDVYDALDIRQLDTETKQYTYRFPDEIMPESIKKKWGVYLASVYRHLQAVEEMKSRYASDETRAAVSMLDTVRKNNHDSLASDFTAVMGLSDRDGWDFTTARNLLATIRDRTYPTLGSLQEDLAERGSAQRVLHDNLDGVLIGEALGSIKHH